MDASISESLFNMLEGCVPEYAASGTSRPPSGSTLTGVVPSGTWKCKDGEAAAATGCRESKHGTAPACLEACSIPLLLPAQFEPAAAAPAPLTSSSPPALLLFSGNY